MLLELFKSKKVIISVTSVLIIVIALSIQYEYVSIKQKQLVEDILSEKLRSASETVLFELPKTTIKTNQGKYEVPVVDKALDVQALFNKEMLLIIQDSRMPLFRLESTDMSFQAGFNEGIASVKIKYTVEAGISKTINVSFDVNVPRQEIN